MADTEGKSVSDRLSVSLLSITRLGYNAINSETIFAGTLRQGKWR